MSFTSTTVEDLPCELTTIELARKSEELALAMKRYREIEAEKKSVTATLTQKLKDESEKAFGLARDIETKSERRPIECVQRPRYEVMLVDIVRTDTGETIRTRAMHPAERQSSMPFATNEDERRKRRGRQLKLAETPSDDDTPPEGDKH